MPVLAWWWYAIAVAGAVVVLALLLWGLLRSRRGRRDRLEIDAFARTRSLTSSWSGGSNVSVREAHVGPATVGEDEPPVAPPSGDVTTGPA